MGTYLCQFDDLPDGGSRGFDPGGQGHDTIFVVRSGAALHAWRDRCPHYGTTPLPWRKDAYLNARGTRVVCASHGAQFDITTGECILGPCLGQKLQAVRLTIAKTGAVHALDETEWKG